jgi:pilus assembly protein CpaC
MSKKHKPCRLMIVSSLVLMMLASVFPLSSWGAASSSVMVEGPTPGELHLAVGKSITLKSERPVKRVSIGDPEIADFVILSPRIIHITAKAPGTTNLVLWGNGSVSAIYDLEVAIDVSGLKKKLHEILPDEGDLKVVAMHDAITLSGTISSATNLSQALALAEAYAPADKIINLVQVAGVHQVMLEVRVAEMSRTLGKQLGVNLNYASKGGNFGISKLNNLTQLVAPEDANLFTPNAPFATLVNPAINALFRFTTGGNTWTFFIDALKEEGLIKILAEPTLISLSGQTADFLAGGEFPVPVPQGLGTAAIEYKAFGVGVSFTPTVLSNDKISIKVAPEVSELDFSTAILVEGFVVPGITTRRSSTVVELGDGQSFAIAGLLKDNARNIVSKFPILGDLPVLGVLFRSTSFQKSETELVIVVTPHLVKPLDMEKTPLPTDFYIEPDDTELYLLGLTEGRKKPPSQSSQGALSPSVLSRRRGFDGEFGHIIP